MSQDHSESKTPLTYKDAGVDIDAGDAFIDRIKPFAKKTQREGCLSGLGGFGALFEIPTRYKQPILVSGTDGVGTKLRLAFACDKHDTIGIDLVAMCVNDVLVQGAEPLFFLDYFATGKLSGEVAENVVKGIAEGCLQSNAALIGGETAEMPGMYAKNEYDLAGFCVGAVEKSQIIDGSKVKPGDRILGLASSGAHSNGYSLIRKVLENSSQSLSTTINNQSLQDLVLAPTKIYVRSVLSILQQHTIHALAHITGGGLPGNITRILPENCHAVINSSMWEWPDLFQWLQKSAHITTNEMYRTFNCGIGMVLIVDPEEQNDVEKKLNALGETCYHIGEIQSGKNKDNVIIQ